MFFVWVQTMVKNRSYDILDRHPEVLSQAPEASDLFGIAGMQWLGQTVLAGEDDRLLTSELELFKPLKEKISQSNGTVKKLAKGDKRAKLLQSISGGKVFHGRITKTGSKWLRWAAIEAAQTAVRSDSEFRAYYQRIRIRKGTNAAKVATARRLLTIVYRLLR